MKLHVVKGLPASGKTTLARELVEKEGNTVRINRDDLRAMCFNSKWTGHREKFIVAAEKVLVDLANAKGYNAIVDDTNLIGTKDMWEGFAKQIGMTTQLHDLTDVGLMTCVERDAQRPKPVGRPVIERMAAQGHLINWGVRRIVVFDIDNTIADLAHRLHFIAEGREGGKDHAAFFMALGGDDPFKEIIRWAQEIAKTHTIVLVSGRPDNYWVATRLWLATNLMPYDHIFMRRAGDRRPDDLVKSEIAKLLPLDLIDFVVDDRPRVIRMWKALGLKVIPVNQEQWEGKGD